ncbi:hypothetical protein ACQPXB_22265 [Amycolatopsis sp. CA-161197]|uniref:hypothetical protein n=1 Tax=Amycolatopsis sp. CA-161197 TaxID=3239922 RepID=UPI003D8AA021
MGDGAADLDPGAVGDVEEPAGGDGAERIEVGAQEFDGVAVSGDAGGPQVRRRELERRHAG